jgi:hypothetical protein
MLHLGYGCETCGKKTSKGWDLKLKNKYLFNQNYHLPHSSLFLCSDPWPPLSSSSCRHRNIPIRRRCYCYWSRYHGFWKFGTLKISLCVVFQEKEVFVWCFFHKRCGFANLQKVIWIKIEFGISYKNNYDSSWDFIILNSWFWIWLIAYRIRKENCK